LNIIQFSRNYSFHFGQFYDFVSGKLLIMNNLIFSLINLKKKF